MIYLFINICITIVSTNFIQCPTDIEQSCTEEYDPVCGFSELLFQITYVNKCFACKEYKSRNKFNGYFEGQCQSGFSFIEIDQDVTIYSSKPFYYTRDMHYAEAEGIIIDCFGEEDLVCGMQGCESNQTSSNYYGSQHNACMEIYSYDYLYFHGDCKNYPEEMPKLMDTLLEYKICQNQNKQYVAQSSEPQNCDVSQFPCYTQKCSDRPENCSDVFQNQTCEEYKQSYQILSDYQIKRVNQDNTTTLFYIELACSYPSTTTCDNSTNQVCASYRCGDTTCRQNYQNECLACMNETTISYYQDQCRQFKNIKKLIVQLILTTLLFL